MTGALREETGEGGEVLRSPGLLLKHYAPKARLVLIPWSDEGDLTQQLMCLAIAPERTQVISHTHVPSGAFFAGVSVIPHDAEAFARALYSELHRCDAGGAKTIVVEAVPDHPEWRAIADRLCRENFPEVKHSGCPLRGRLPMHRRSCWRMNRPRAWIPPMGNSSSG